MSPLIVQRFMRHSSLAITLEFYSKVQVKEDAAVIREKLASGKFATPEKPVTKLILPDSF